MGINLGAGFESVNNNQNQMQQPTGGLTLNLNKNDILDLTKRNPGLKNVMLGAGWDLAANGADFDLDIAAFLLDANNSYVRLLDMDQNQKELCRFDLKENGSTATSVLFAELDRDGADWQFKAVGEGKIADLNGVLALYQ